MSKLQAYKITDIYKFVHQFLRAPESVTFHQVFRLESF